MAEKTSSAWLRVSVVEVRQGATYQGIVYDQDVVVRTGSGEALTLFDMAPMIAVGVQPGEFLDVIVAISTPADLKRASVAHSSNAGVIDSIDYEPPRNDSARLRAELFGRRWCRLETSVGYFLMAVSEIVPAFPRGIVIGERLSWENGRLDLMAWKRAFQEKN